MSDIGLAAFSVFFMQSPSFLAHQKSLEELRGRSNANTLFGMTKIPSDNHIRQMLDGAPTDHSDGVFAEIVRNVDASGGLAKRIHRYRWMDGVPLRDGKDALTVNWLEIEISKPNGKVT